MQDAGILGGVFHPSLETQRSSAEIVVRDIAIVAITPSGEEISLSYDDVELDVGGATGKMIFIKSLDKQTTIFTEDWRLVEKLSRTSLHREAERIRQQHQKHNMNSWMWWGIFLGSFGLGIWFIIANVPMISDFVVSFLPEEADVSVGKMAGQYMDKDGVEIHDKEITEPIQQIVDILTEDGNEAWEFDLHVVDADITNAFALPGGYIVVYTGLIKKTERPEQLAGVLAHEISHVTQRHGMQRLVEGAGLALIVDGLLGNVEGLIALATQVFSVSTASAYSREAETEADMEGLRLLAENGIDTQGMVEFFQILDADPEKSEIEDMIPTWIRSHPENQERISNLQEAIDSQSLPQKEVLPLVDKLHIEWDVYKEKL